MTMDALRLYHMPGACSRVALVALEEIGLPYEDVGVALMRGEQRGAAFRAVNTKGKVPVLASGEAVFTELPTILYVLARAHPRAGLLPASAEGRVELAALSDLVWLAGALHPLANRIFRPGAVSTADAQGVKANAIAQLADHAALICERLSAAPWWYGQAWSMTDVFSAWIFGVAGAWGFSLPDYPVLAAHRERVEARPAFRRALERERAAVRRDGLDLPPGVVI